LITTEVVTGRLRPAWAEIDLGAIRHNASVLADLVAPARLCAVVKAAGYGHGAVEAAQAALEGGATWLAVALVEEGLELRAAGIQAPVLLLSQPAPEAMPEAVAGLLTPTVYTPAGLEAVREAVEMRPGPAAVLDKPAGGRFPVQVKVDTGMHRVGADPEEAIALARAIDLDPRLHLEGLWTHFAVADELGESYTVEQLARFDATAAALAKSGVRPTLLHSANSAGAMWYAASRYDLVRCGIALYGLSPCAAGLDRAPVPELRPAFSLKARISHVQERRAGERLSYGLRYRLDRDSVVATVPIGYADGVTRALSSTGGEVLVRGRRCPIAGTVTMDQILVDCGPGFRVAVGDEVVLLGRQGGECITAWEWALRTGTIAYEVVCGISGRVPRIPVGR
jgi:alanine racemase